MSRELAHLIRRTVDAELPHLRALADQDALHPRAPGKWCPKEELGHLIDSASNNHQRFVRAGLGPEFRGPSYAPDDWVRIHGYRDMPWQTLVVFWHEYNVLLAELAARIPEASFQNPCFIADYAPNTLAFVIEDYVVHMQHHIDLLLRRPVITAYPRT